jgi:hypothetical protein
MSGHRRCVSHGMRELTEHPDFWDAENANNEPPLDGNFYTDRRQWLRRSLRSPTGRPGAVVRRRQSALHRLIIHRRKGGRHSQVVTARPGDRPGTARKSRAGHEQAAGPSSYGARAGRTDRKHLGALGPEVASSSTLSSEYRLRKQFPVRRSMADPAEQNIDPAWAQDIPVAIPRHRRKDVRSPRMLVTDQSAPQAASD